MKLINITNTHSKLVDEQLAGTDAKFVKVYSLGQSTVIYSGAPTHNDVLIINRKRPVKDVEIDFVLQRTLKVPKDTLDIIRVGNFVEITQKIHSGRPLFKPVYNNFA
ncbi:DUF1827 family protein [Atopobacter phocae]|uniref:DUF1827 family protein n=1 Tax=Atopobacter phocae TaxID=136492 RepID=UPI0004701F3F|nr:DUF1827 family protein [Atopobacter phocae]